MYGLWQEQFWKLTHFISAWLIEHVAHQAAQQIHTVAVFLLTRDS